MFIDSSITSLVINFPCKYSSTLLSLSIVFVIAFITTLILLPESNVNRDKKQKRKLFDFEAAGKIFNRPQLATTVLLFFVLTFSVACIYGTFALLGYKVYGFTDMQNGYMYGIIGLSSAIVQGGLINYLTKMLKQKRVLIAGSFLMMLGLALIPYGGTFAWLAVIVSVLSLGTGTLQPTLLSLISEVTPDSEQGITLGVNQSLSALGRVLGPLWGGFAFEFMGYEFPFLTGAAFTLIILIVSMFYLPKILRKHAEDVPSFE